MPNRTRLLLHLTRKDWRALRTLAALCWALTAARWLMVEPMSGGDRFLGPLLLLVPLLLVVRLVHLDAPLGTTQFWLTRPVPARTLAASKLLAVFLMVVLPSAVIETAPLALTGVPLEAADYALVSLTTVLWYTAFSAFALVPAVVTRSARAAVLLAVAWVMALRIAWWWLLPVHLAVAAQPLPIAALEAAGASTIVWRSYRTRGRGFTVALALLMLAAPIAAARWWPWERGTPSPPEAGPSAPWRRVRVRLEWPSARQQADGGGDGSVRAVIAVENLPSDLVLVETGYDATAIVGGAERHRAADRRWSAGAASPYWTPRFESVVLGCREDAPPVVAIFELEPEGRPADLSALQRVHGRLHFSVVRPVVEGRAPISEGSTLSARGWRLTVSSVAYNFRRIRSQAVQALASRFPSYVVWFDSVGKRCHGERWFPPWSPAGLPYAVDERPLHFWNRAVTMPWTTAHDELVVLGGQEVGRFIVPFDLSAPPPP
jgi:hypothetical protein